MKRLACLAALSLLAASGPEAQPTKASMIAIKMPRPSFHVTKTLTYKGDYGYFPLGTDRPLDHLTVDLGDPRNWFWARYINQANVREIYAWVSLYPNAQNICNHGHISYGVWGKYAYVSGGFPISGWVRLGMGTQSGEMINGSCKWDVQNTWVQCCGADFGWGTNYAHLDIRSEPLSFKYTEFVVGGITVSHGAGQCGAFLCGHPVYSVLYSLP